MLDRRFFVRLCSWAFGRSICFWLAAAGWLLVYIVANTLRPLCQQIADRLDAAITKTEEACKRSRGGNREA
jgi:hypothetical protein